MRYVLPTVPNVYSYTTMMKMDCQSSTCLRTGTGFISTELFLSIPMLHDSVNAHGGQIEHLFWLSCLRCQVLLVFLTLPVFFFTFLNFMHFLQKLFIQYSVSYQWTEFQILCLFSSHSEWQADYVWQTSDLSPWRQLVYTLPV